MPRSADVVFIIEAKECNADLIGKRNFNILLSTLSKELIDVGLTGNRYLEGGTVNPFLAIEFRTSAPGSSRSSLSETEANAAGNEAYVC